MKIINVEQGSQEWLDLRRKCITATDASIINGTNHFTTPLELWERKLGLRPEIEVTEKMLEGQRLEPIARDILNMKTGHAFKPCVVISEKYPYIMASLDGLSECSQYICELKCGKSAHAQALKGIIPAYYFCQCQHALFCTDAKKCYYQTMDEEDEIETVVIEVLPDQEYVDILIGKELDFYHNHLYSFIPTPPPEPFKF
jgi:putative phage-type endonuclease